jgi:hypothetical protein
MNNLLWSLFPALLLSACAAPPGITLPSQQAWIDGKRVEYVTTDISDGTMATQAGINHVPRLAGAVGAGSASLTERVYKFADGADQRLRLRPRRRGSDPARPELQPAVAAGAGSLEAGQALA